MSKEKKKINNQFFIIYFFFFVLPKIRVTEAEVVVSLASRPRIRASIRKSVLLPQQLWQMPRAQQLPRHSRAANNAGALFSPIQRVRRWKYWLNSSIITANMGYQNYLIRINFPTNSPQAKKVNFNVVIFLPYVRDAPG